MPYGICFDVIYIQKLELSITEVLQVLFLTGPTAITQIL